MKGWMALGAVLLCSVLWTSEASAQYGYRGGYRGPNSRYFGMTRRPSISPYIGLYQGGGVIPNYQTFTRPQLQLQSFMARDTDAIRYNAGRTARIESTLRDWSSKGAVGPTALGGGYNWSAKSNTTSGTTGIGAVHDNLSHYYGTRGGRR